MSFCTVSYTVRRQAAEYIVTIGQHVVLLVYLRDLVILRSLYARQTTLKYGILYLYV